LIETGTTVTLSTSAAMCANGGGAGGTGPVGGLFMAAQVGGCPLAGLGGGGTTGGQVGGVGATGGTEAGMGDPPTSTYGAGGGGGGVGRIHIRGTLAPTA